MDNIDSGLQFDFSYAPETSIEQIVAFETAGMMWSDYLTDDMTVNIHVEMTNELPSNVVGGALPAMENDISYADFRDALKADIKSDRDRQSYDSLSLKYENGLEKFESRIDMGYDILLEDADTIDMTRANAKALGLIEDTHDPSLDGYILMNDLSESSINWSYTPGQSVARHIDYFSVAVHEIGHVLGFVSGLDKYEPVKFSDKKQAKKHFKGDWSTLNDYINNVMGAATPLDMFRYSKDSLKLAKHYDRNVIDLSVGEKTYFGAGKLDYQYATGKGKFGDGFQASHWKEKKQKGGNKTTGIMDPLMSLGNSRHISDRDLRAMDAIGYDLATNGKSLVDWADRSGLHQEIGKNSLHSLIPHAKDHLVKENTTDPNAQGWWVDWVIHFMPEYADLYLNQDRTEDVLEMIEESLVYEGRRGSRTYSHQETSFWQSAYFSSFSWQEFNLEPTVIDEFSVMPVIEEDFSTPAFTAVNNRNSGSNSNEAINQNLDLPNDATVNLLTVSETEEISTVSTEIELELPVESSLYGELAKLELFASAI